MSTHTSLAVLTNGFQWWLYVPIERQKIMGRFWEFDISVETPDSVRDNFSKYLDRDKTPIDRRVLTEARAIFRRRQKQKDADKALTSAWNKLTNDSPELVGFLSSITKHRYDEDMVREFIRNVRVPLVQRISGKSPRPWPSSFTFQVEGEDTVGPIPVKSQWSPILGELCLLMHQRHPEKFVEALRAMPSAWFT